MPKTSKPINWEVYDESGDFIDILSMTRDDMKAYRSSHEGYTVKEIDNNDGGDDTWETGRETRRNIHSVRIPKRHRKFQDVYEAP